MHIKFDISKHSVLLFDLGGVILDLSFANTFNAFAKLSNKRIHEIENDFSAISFFKDFETGHLTESEFRSELTKLLCINVTDEILDQAWNAMLGILPTNRLQVLEKLSKSHTLILFSNTNSIHLKAFTEIVKQSGTKSFDSYFSTAYYSHLVGRRKPDRATYQWICKQHNFEPNTILFFDDNLANLQGASEVGINTFHVTDADELFKELDCQL